MELVTRSFSPSLNVRLVFIVPGSFGPIRSECCIKCVLLWLGKRFSWLENRCNGDNALLKASLLKIQKWFFLTQKKAYVTTQTHPILTGKEKTSLSLKNRAFPSAHPCIPVPGIWLHSPPVFIWLQDLFGTGVDMDINTTSTAMISQMHTECIWEWGMLLETENYLKGSSGIAKTLWLHRHQDICRRSNPHQENMEMIGSRTNSSAQDKEEGRGSSWQGRADENVTGKVGGIL